MGYFQAKMRRGRAREQTRSFVEAVRAAGPLRWTSRFDLRGVDRAAYLRFVVRGTDGRLVGLFRGSRDRIDHNADLPDVVRSQARATFRWFNRNLPVPPHLPFGAVCWFRADAEVCVKQLSELVEAYRMAGHPVWMVASRVPGRVVYRDGLQVAAIPLVDSMRTASVW